VHLGEENPNMELLKTYQYIQSEKLHIMSEKRNSETLFLTEEL
jgi:hypothetical protein